MPLEVVTLFLIKVIMLVTKCITVDSKMYYPIYHSPTTSTSTSNMSLEMVTLFLPKINNISN